MHRGSVCEDRVYPHGVDEFVSAPWVHTRHAMHVNRLGATVVANIL